MGAQGLAGQAWHAVPATFEELDQTIRAFVNQDPNGNGIKDTYGLCTTNSIDEVFGTFMSFHAHPSTWIKNVQGELVFGAWWYIDWPLDETHTQWGAEWV